MFWHTDDYKVINRGGTRVRRTPKIKGKANVKAAKKARTYDAYRRTYCGNPPTSNIEGKKLYLRALMERQVARAHFGL
jgi:hypothetical protein